MAENYRKRNSSDVEPEKKQEIREKRESYKIFSDDESIETTEKTDSGQETSPYEKSSPTADLTSETSGIEVKKESTASDLPSGAESPKESVLLSSGSISWNKSTEKVSFFSRAKGMASRSIDAFRRGISPRSQTNLSDESSRSNEVRKDATKKSQLRTLTQWKIHSSGGQRQDHSTDEHEPMLCEDEQESLSEEEETTVGAAKRGKTMSKRTIMQRFKDKLTISKRIGSNTSAACPPVDTDQVARGETRNSDLPSNISTARDKSSSFAFGWTKSCDSLEISQRPKLTWSATRQTLHLSLSDTTEEFDLDEMGSPDWTDRKVLASTDDQLLEASISVNEEEVPDKLNSYEDENSEATKGAM